MKEILFDQFLFVVILVITAFVLIDWLIGEDSRKKHREALGELWLYIECNSLFAVAHKGVEESYHFIRRIVTGKGGVARVLIISYSLSALVTLAYLYFNHDGESWFGGDYFGGMFLYVSPNIDDSIVGELNVLASILAVLIANPLTDGLSILITLAILHYFISRAKTIGFLLLLIFVDIFAAIVIFMVTLQVDYWLYGHLHWNIITPLFDPEFTHSGISFIDFEYPDLPLSSYWWTIAHNGPTAILETYPLLIPATSLWPTLLHLTAMVGLLFVKITQPITKPIIGSILYAFYDSKKGVLSTLAVGIGATLKLVQTYTKGFM